jgi:hypothetical protein
MNIKTLASVAIASATFAAPLFMFSEPVGAGTNGQQLAVKASNLAWICKAGIQVTVSGYNQSNQYTTRTDSTGCDGIARTYNSWWKGNVTIKTFSNVFGSRTCTANVPVNQGSNNWYNVNCY